MIEPLSNNIKEGGRHREAAGADVADAQISGGNIGGRSRDRVAATEDISGNETAFEANVMIKQVPKVKPGKPPKPPQLSSASRIGLDNTPVRPDGLGDVMKELVDTLGGRQR